MSKYRYIAIEGNIGAGKSTLAKLLAARMQHEYMPEHFQDNPFLHSFYASPERYALSVELAFLEERFRHVRDAVTDDKWIIADYLWEKSLVFARVNLKGEELKLFERIYHHLTTQLPVPDLVIYLHLPSERLLKQIAGRGRDFEQKIPAEYLRDVASGYRDYFASERRFPVLWLNHDLGPEALAQYVARLMDRKFPPGLNMIER